MTNSNNTRVVHIGGKVSEGNETSPVAMLSGDSSERGAGAVEFEFDVPIAAFSGATASDVVLATSTVGSATIDPSGGRFPKLVLAFYHGMGDFSGNANMADRRFLGMQEDGEMQLITGDTNDDLWVKWLLIENGDQPAPITIDTDGNRNAIFTWLSLVMIEITGEAV